MKSRTIVAVVCAALSIGSAQAQETPPDTAELWRLLQQQQAEIKALQKELAQTRSRVAETQSGVAENRERVAATGETLDQVVDQGSGAESATHLGGYGEMHYNGGDKDEIDFHRFVLFAGHQFNDRTRFYSELEVEHAFLETTEVAFEDGGLEVERTPGELELEQAYVEYDLNATLTARGGVFLLPVGIINETHEPPTFYGVERNPVEKNIIPATWWEGGAMLSGRYSNGFSFDLAAHSGLKTDSEDRFLVRKGRQKVAEASAKDPAFTSRLRYAGIPGLELAASFQYQTDISQGADPAGDSATLFEGHAVYNTGAFGLRALYARWDLDGAGPKAFGTDEQVGWYVEPSYRFSDQIGVFARFNQWDNVRGDRLDSEYQQFDLGLNYWLHDDVVLKVDYQFQNAPQGKTDDDRINLGIGYRF